MSVPSFHSPPSSLLPSPWKCRVHVLLMREQLSTAADSCGWLSPFGSCGRWLNLKPSQKRIGKRKRKVFLSHSDPRVVVCGYCRASDVLSKTVCITVSEKWWANPKPKPKLNSFQSQSQSQSCSSVGQPHLPVELSAIHMHSFSSAIKWNSY